MKFLVRALIALIPTLAICTHAQTISPGTFKHIIFVVQENRTPDNLFGSGATGPCGTSNPFAPGVDIRNGGFYLNDHNRQISICNVSQSMNAQRANGGFDPGHLYQDWSADYDNGNMDGFCHGFTPCTQAPSPYSYIQLSDVQPYFDIATTYGFANYMFQTNEGPSFPAHQFLFTGTSAPVAPNDPQGFSWDFVRNNPPKKIEFYQSGCPYSNSTQYPFARWIEPDRTYIDFPTLPECYTHDSLVTSSNCTNGVCDKNVTWRYYSPTPSGIIWNAPEAIPEVCYGENDLNYVGQPCGSVNNGAEWNHMSFYSKMNTAPILNDIQNCQLQQISWVIPDLAWSDHPFPKVLGAPFGPSWVASIVNAIGQSYENSNHKCDYWGTNLPQHRAEPTAIFIVWDDWGGFYDHVQPPKVWTGTAKGRSWTCPAPNAWGCGYTYGFRVPLLVVSEFTGTLSAGNYSGYVSGACGISGKPSCPNTESKYQHDFGSMLAFTEYNFGFNLPFIAEPYYADYNALDWGNDRSNIPLSDFFSLWAGSGSVGRPFVQIRNTYPASFFQNYYATHNAVPTGPDED